MNQSDTIAAIATAPGVGGVGIIRISGDKAQSICYQLTRKKLQPKYAQFTHFSYQCKS